MSEAPRTPIASPRFVSFLVTQFLGAANDNAFKVTLMLMILARVTDEAQQLRLNSVVTMLFPLPFLLFSPLAGSLADRFRKSRFLVVTRSPEVLAMICAIGALATGELPVLLGVLFLMSTQSAFFSPVKYGLLPEAIATRDLSMANGLLQMTTNLAILAGTVGGMAAWTAFRDTPATIGAIFLVVAVVGTAFALWVPTTPPGRRDVPLTWNIFGSARRDYRIARAQPALFHTILGIAYFGFVGALFLTVIPVFARSLGLSEVQSGAFLVLLSVGIALGSVIAGKLSHGNVEVGLVPIGSLGLALASLDLGLFGHGLFRGLPVRAWIDVFLLGLSAGFYVVPLNALLQQRSPEGMKGRLIAFSNVLTFSAVLLAALMPAALTFVGLDTRGIIVICGVLSLAVTVYIVSLLPEFTVRLVLLLVTRMFYRVQVDGVERVPAGGAILVANHVSWIDALLIGTASDRLIRFMMYRPIYESPLLHWFFRRMHAIPVAAEDADDAKEASLAAASDEVRGGHLVCIFAEGAISRTGNLLRFRRGFERIARAVDAPIVPVAIDGLWGSVFSWEKGRLLFKWPRRRSEPVRILFGPALPPHTPADEVRTRVQELTVRAFELRKARQRPIPVEFVRTAKRFWRQPFMADDSGLALRFGQALMGAAALERSIRAGGGGRVAVLLPPGVPAAIANLAVGLAGLPFVDLDVDAPAERLARELDEAGIERVITTRACLDSLPGRDALAGRRTMLLDELPAPRNPPGLALACRLLPRGAVARLLVRGDRRDVDRTAAVVFSPAPEQAGASVGVLLSHHNVLSNLESLKQVFRVSRDDIILGTLPFSNTFGLTGTLLLPAIAGVRVAWVRNPGDIASIEQVARERRITILPVSSPHLTAIVEQVSPDALSNLRHAVVSGGLLAPEVRHRFVERFGVEPLEGFGCPECAPLVSLNFPVLARRSERQSGHRPGTSGQPLPGIAVRIVDRETGATRPTGRHGLLMVKGPNVMQGYLADEAATARAVTDGWYRTGYLAVQDADGFLTVLGLADDGVPAAERRPRDIYGRPLPSGSTDRLGAVEPARVVRGAGEAQARARALWNDQRFFEAHEFYEYLWRDAEGGNGERALWRGMTQLAAAFCHAQRGNVPGTIALIERGARLVERGDTLAVTAGVDTLPGEARALAQIVAARGASASLPFPVLTAE